MSIKSDTDYTSLQYLIGDFTFADIIIGGNVHRWFELLRSVDEVEKLGLYEPGSSNSRVYPFSILLLECLIVSSLVNLFVDDSE